MLTNAEAQFLEGHKAGDDGVGSMVMITTALRSRCRHQPMLTAAEKLLLQDLYPRLPIPPRRKATELRWKNDGVGQASSHQPS